MKGISKRFHGVQALNNVNFHAKLGKVTALVGENGAGKSTLIKILAGIHKPDSGDVILNGQVVSIQNPTDAMQNKISIIHQELNIIPNLTIAENIFIGKEQKKGLFVDKEYCYEKTKQLLNSIGLSVNPKLLAKFLSTAQKQMVEIIRAISSDVKIVVMDEPTSSLTQKETQKLFDIISTLKKQNVAIIFISHRLDEILELADHVVVLRDGMLAGELSRSEMTGDKIIKLMVGRELKDLFPERAGQHGKVVLECKNISAGFIQNVSFSVRQGEILGFSGLVGAGRSEIMRLIFGIDKKDLGDIFIEGEKISIDSPADAIQAGIALVPEDRKEQALILGMSVKDNLTLVILDKIKSNLFYSIEKEKEIAKKYIKSMQIVPSRADNIVKNLSGGNQQKVVLGKWLASSPKILILDEPTHGIDIGAKKEIHELISNLADQGLAILLISSDLVEILGMSDRIIVMHEGLVMGELTKEEADQEKIMQIALGTRS